MAVEAFSVVNAALFTLAVYGNYENRHDDMQHSRTHKTLITPASYSFVIYRVIYTLMASLLVADIVAPSYSIFESAALPPSLFRMAFVTCIGCVGWVGGPSKMSMNLALLQTTMLWLALFLVHLHVLMALDDFSYARYFVSELGLTIYLAWTSVVLTVQAAVSMQNFYCKLVPLAVYVGLLTALSVGTVFFALYY